MSDSKNNVDSELAGRLLDVIDSWKWLGSLVVIALLCVGYFWVPSLSDNRDAVDLARSVIANLIPVFLLVVVSWWLFRTVERVREAKNRQGFVAEVTAALRDELQPLIPGHRTVYDRFDRVPWDDMLATASAVYIIVQYFDSWAKERQDALAEFFGRGGRLRLLLPDPEDAAALGQIAMRFHVGEQSGIKTKIENTPVRFNMIRRSAGSSGTLDVRFVKLPIWYCALRFDNHSVALSPFESKRNIGVSSPCFVSRGKDAEAVVAWFDKDFSFLWDQAREWRPSTS